MWRLLCHGQPTCSVQKCWSLLEQLPQGLRSAVNTPGLQALLQQQQSLHHTTNRSGLIIDAWNHRRHLHSTSSACSSDPPGSTASEHQQQQQHHHHQQQQQHDQAVLQPLVSPATAVTELQTKQPAAAAGRHRQLAKLEQSGFVTLPPQATASGYQESFLSTSQPQPDATSSTSSSSSSSSTPASEWPIQQIELPQEQLRIVLRQEVQEEEVQHEVDAYSLSRSLITNSRSFDTAAAEAAADQQQQQQRAPLTASDRQLLEKLVGIMTKEGKKSRARRILLDAMHVIKQQVAKGQRGA